MRLAILCPVLSGSEKVQGKFCLVIGSVFGTSIEKMEAYIYVLLEISLGTTPRTVQSTLSVSLYDVRSGCFELHVYNGLYPFELMFVKGVLPSNRTGSVSLGDM